MSSEYALASVVRFSKMPITPEKEEIQRMFLNDETGRFEYYDKALDYLERHNESNTVDS